MAVMGRPRKEVDWDMFDEMCKVFCNQEEICAILGLSADTLSIRIKETFDCTFKELYEEKTSGGKLSLRRAQVKSALDGNASMLKFLGQNYLDQSESKNVSHFVSDKEKSRLVIDFGDDPQNDSEANS